MDNIGNYAKHARIWDWGGFDNTQEYQYWRAYAQQFGSNILIPMCALGEVGAYMANRGFNVTAFDITPEMIAEGRKRFGNTENLKLLQGNVTDSNFDIAPVDFCFCAEFGHLHNIDDIKLAFSCINRHMRAGGGFVIETGLRAPQGESKQFPPKTFYPNKQVYPGLKIWKVGEGYTDGESGRHYISQTVNIEDENGKIEETFEHSFYLQSYFREEWLDALSECGFSVMNEYGSRDKKSWNDGDDLWIVEAVKR